MKTSLFLIAGLALAGVAGCTKPATGPAPKADNVPAPTAPTAVTPGSGTDSGTGQPAESAPPTANAGE